MWSSQVLSYKLSYITVLWCGTCGGTVWTLSKTDLRVSSLQCGLPSPAESSFTPESCRSLELTSSSLRLQELELRTEARASQHLSDRRQPFSLHTHNTRSSDKVPLRCIRDLLQKWYCSSVGRLSDIIKYQVGSVLPPKFVFARDG